MASITQGAAVSHVGKVRSNNQDSAYAGGQLFVVADGMGGHAGGDVASAIAVNRIAETDTQFYASAHDAEFALQSALVAANQLLAETVFEHPELTGMGTTVSAMIRVQDSIAIAHIGDSRIYLLRDEELSQITADHTFVQRLVDSGRITPEEATTHPRRSVLMRVLGDIDASPEIDTSILATRTGDRWMLCSDGLSSYVPEEKIRSILQDAGTPDDVANRLIREALDHGAPDNVTVVVVDIDREGEVAPTESVTVGSAATPLEFEGDGGRRLIRLPTILLHPIKASSTARESHFEPDSEDYLDALIEEDRLRARRRRVTWLVGIGLIIVAVIVALILSYQWTQSRYYVGVNGQTVAIYQGVQQTIGPIQLSHVFQDTDVKVDDLPAYYQDQVTDTVNADSITDAFQIVSNLEQYSEQ
jgi:serine/threonine protein phosphatase PrpC